MKSQSKNFREGNMNFENGILYIKYDPKIVIDEQLLYKQFMFRKQLAEEKDLHIIADLRLDADLTDEAKAFVASHSCPEQAKAIAIVTKPGADHIKTKLYFILEKPNVKTKVFLNEEDAKIWFKQLEQNKLLFEAC